MVAWPVWRKAGCDPSCIWAACYRSAVESKAGARNLWYAQDFWWNRKCINSIQWLLGHSWYSRAIKIYSIYEEEGEESRTKENRPLHLEMFSPWCSLPFWWWRGPTSAAGWLLIFSRGFSPKEPLPLHLMRGNTGSGKSHRNPGGCTSPSVSDGPVHSELLPHARLSFWIVQYGCRSSRQELTAAILIITGVQFWHRVLVGIWIPGDRFFDVGARSPQRLVKLIMSW